MAEEMHFETPEQEIKYLEQKIIEKKRELADHEPREVVKSVIDEHSSAIAEPPPAPPPIAAPSDDLDKDVASLVQVAFREGVMEAIKRARATRNPHLIDAFHDALTDKFLQELIGRGILPPHG
jgi:hypothetical protein